MQLNLYFSKRNDMDLYAYFSFVSKGKAQVVKSILKAYLHGTVPEGLSVCPYTYEDILQAEKPRVSVALNFVKKDSELVEFLNTAAKGAKGAMVKSILRMYLAPYCQNVYRFEPVPFRVPKLQAADGMEQVSEAMTQFFRQLSTFVPGGMAPGMATPTIREVPLPREETVLKETVSKEEVASKEEDSHSVVCDQTPQPVVPVLNSDNIPQSDKLLSEVQNGDFVEEETEEEADSNMLDLFGVDFG